MERTAQLISSRLTLFVRWAIVLALTALLVSMATGQSGIANYMELQKKRDELQDISLQLAAQNQMMEQEISALKTSREAQLHYLKEEFGYVERGEVIYHFSRGANDNEKQANKAAHRARIAYEPRS